MKKKKNWTEWMAMMWGSGWSEVAPGCVRIECRGTTVTTTDDTSASAAVTASVEALQVATCQDVDLRRMVGGWMAETGALKLTIGESELEAVWRLGVSMGAFDTGEENTADAIVRELASLNTRLTAAEGALQALIEAMGMLKGEHAPDCDMDEDCSCHVGQEVAGG